VTLIEVLAMATLFVMVSGVLYKLFSGTWSNFYKSQTKLTNLRAASLLLEHLKHDIRMATIPTANPASKFEISPPGTDLNLKFQISDGIDPQVVRYSFDSASGNVERSVNDTQTRTLSQVKVAEFAVKIEGTGPNKRLRALIKVDADKDEKNRSEASQGNQVELSAIMFPKFFQDFVDPEEKYWNNARSVQ
jgi:hypothetical protein